MRSFDMAGATLQKHPEAIGGPQFPAPGAVILDRAMDEICRLSHAPAGSTGNLGMEVFNKPLMRSTIHLEVTSRHVAFFGSFCMETESRGKSLLSRNKRDLQAEIGKLPNVVLSLHEGIAMSMGDDPARRGSPSGYCTPVLHGMICCIQKHRTSRCHSAGA
jgi:hypothetical protein